MFLILLVLGFNSYAQSIYITGSIESKTTQHVLMPLVPSFNGKISEMVQEGIAVKKGDFLLRIDGSNIDSQIESEVEQLEIFKASAIKAALDLKIQLNTSQITYDSAKIAHKIAQMKAETPLEFIGELAYKGNQLQLKNTDKSYKKSVNDLKEAKLKIIEQQKEEQLGIIQKQKKLDYLQSSLALFTTYASQEGYVIYATKAWSGEKIQIGDQMNSGSKVLRVSQNKDLQIIAWVNAIDLPKLNEEQKVSIQFDAFLDQSYRGKIVSKASGGEDKKIWGNGLYYKVLVEIIDKTPDNLLLGMSALIKVDL